MNIEYENQEEIIIKQEQYIHLDTIKEKFTTGSPKTERKESVVSFPTNKSNI